MNILPQKDNKGIWTLAIITMVLVLIMFLNTYTGPNKQAMFGFLKKTPTV
jgi:hypothetical protein